MAKKIEKGFMEDPEKFQTKLNDWLIEAEGSKSATVFRTESMEDYRFYAGNQDTEAVRETLILLKRPATTYNEVKPKIDMLVGLGAQMKAVPFPVPTQKADQALTELMGGVYTHFRGKLKSSRVELSCFEHMVKAGLSYQHYWVNEENPFKPEIKTQRVPARDCWVDPQSTEYDMSDARFFFRDKWLDKDTIETLYPDMPLAQMQHGTVATDRPRYFDLTTELYRLVECWFRHLDMVRWFINPVTQKPEWLLIPEFKKFEAALRSPNGIPMPGGTRFRLEDEQDFEYKEQFKSNVYYAMFMDTTILDAGPTGFKHDSFPYIQYGAYNDEDLNRWFGAITMMKDPQRNLNTMRRQLTHMLQTSPKGILMHESGAILNIEDFETKSADPTYHMEITQGKLDKVKFTDQPQISPVYQYLDGMNSQGMKDTSGVQDSLMGVQTSSREPGVSVQMRQEQNIAVLHILFSNYKESRRLSATQMLSLIQQFITEEEVIRIEGQEGMELISINSQMNPQTEGFNDITALEYDMVVDEDIESTSTHLATMRMLTDFSVANPGTIPPDVLMEYGNLPMSVQRRVLEFYEARRQEELDLKMAEINSKNNSGGSNGTKSEK